MCPSPSRSGKHPGGRALGTGCPAPGVPVEPTPCVLADARWCLPPEAPARVSLAIVCVIVGPVRSQPCGLFLPPFGSLLPLPGTSSQRDQLWLSTFKQEHQLGSCHLLLRSCQLCSSGPGTPVLQV